LCHSNNMVMKFRGHDVAYPSDFSEMKSLAQKAASKFKRYKYTVGNSAELLYPAAGT